LDTYQSRFAPLWAYPCLLEALLLALRHDSEDYRKSFETMCLLMSPEFMDML
jgi:hypothetical protein